MQDFAGPSTVCHHRIGGLSSLAPVIWMAFCVNVRRHGLSVYMLAHICVYICIYICIYMYIYVYIYVSIYVSIYVYYCLSRQGFLFRVDDFCTENFQGLWLVSLLTPS